MPSSARITTSLLGSAMDVLTIAPCMLPMHARAMLTWYIANVPMVTEASTEVVRCLEVSTGRYRKQQSRC